MQSHSLSRQDYLNLVQFVKSEQNGPYIWLEWDEYYNQGIVVPKERPRKGRNGHIYTPEATRNFETRINHWGKDNLKRFWNCPVSIFIWIYDQTDNSDLIRDSIAGLIYYEKKDLDNMGKAICDALNGVMYPDDRKIVDFHVRRRYARDAGFMLRVGRAGLAPHEHETFKRYLAAA